MRNADAGNLVHYLNNWFFLLCYLYVLIKNQAETSSVLH